MTADANRRAFQRALGVRDDGIPGPVTFSAVWAAAGEGRVTVAPRIAAPVTTPEQPASAPVAARGIVRIIMHWTGGGHRASALDRRHYHWLVEGSGQIVQGDTPEEENISTTDRIYAGHTLALNTGSLGIAVCAMHGARKRPFFAGSAPITEPQVKAFCMLAGRLARKWNVPVKRHTVLTHAEVQPTLGIRQRGKWDIAWLPGMNEPADPVMIGDKLRAEIRQAMAAM